MENNKLETLKRQADFQSLKSSGRFLKANDWLLINFKKNNIEKNRPGWTISKKIGNAVTRNRLKRWLRESVRKMENDGIDFNVIFKNQKHREFFKQLSHQELEQELNKAFQKIRARA